ncbi:MAG TPA: FMN-binding negative transcriptional regulator [Pirellulales bacterium]
MFIPASFRVDDLSTLHAFMQRYSFATLVTRTTAGELTATHLPLLLNPRHGEYGALEGHFARANPQWRDVAGDTLVMFTGPHAYISPNWYQAEATVPTWNYAAVHAYGPLELIEAQTEAVAVLERTMEKYESHRPNPWTMERSGAAVTQLLGAIAPFRIPIARLEGKWKLNQHHSPERRALVADALETEGGENNLGVAELMRATPPRSSE